MPRRVLKTTFMYEPLDADVQVRRQVFAGQFAPDHYVEGEDTEADALEHVDPANAPATVGLGAAPHDYQHNVGVPVEEQLKRRGAKADKAAVQAATQGGQAAANAGRVDNPS